MEAVIFRWKARPPSDDAAPPLGGAPHSLKTTALYTHTACRQRLLHPYPTATTLYTPLPPAASAYPSAYPTAHRLAHHLDTPRPRVTTQHTTAYLTYITPGPHLTATRNATLYT